jgi:hypothetical protein
MKEYQEKMLSSNKKIIMCNWERGDGKTYSIVEKLKQLKGKALIVSNYGNVIMDKLQEYCKNEELTNIFKPTYVKIIDKDDITLETIFCKPCDIRNDLEWVRGQKFSYVFFDEYMPSSHEIKRLHQMLWIKQIYIIFTDNDMEYIDSRNYKNKTKTYVEHRKEFNTWAMTQVESLMKEYSEVPKNSNTTMTREKILSMISNIGRIREDLFDRK